jgi:hypothetical protein
MIDTTSRIVEEMKSRVFASHREISGSKSRDRAARFEPVAVRRAKIALGDCFQSVFTTFPRSKDPLFSQGTRANASRTRSFLDPRFRAATRICRGGRDLQLNARTCSRQLSA